MGQARYEWDRLRLAETDYTSVSVLRQLVYDAAVEPAFYAGLNLAGSECRGLSKFHTIALRLVSIKVDDDMLPDMMMWRKVETAAAESVYSAGLQV